MLLCYLVPVMASIVTVKHQLFALSLIIVFVINGKLGNAVYDLIPANGAQSGSQSGQFGGGQSGSQSGQSGSQSGQFGGGQSGSQSGQSGGAQSGSQSGQFGGAQSGSQSGQFGGAQSGSQSGGQSGSIPQNGAQSGTQTGQFGGQFGGQAGGSVEEPTDYVAKALLCFNDNYVYSSCQESYRLSESGDLHVPPEHTDEFCNGPCVTETHLVLNCVGNVMTHFEFYNKATIEDVSDTIKSGCGSGNQRGNFNVAEHIQQQNSRGDKITARLVAGFVLMILVQGLLF